MADNNAGAANAYSSQTRTSISQLANSCRAGLLRKNNENRDSRFIRPGTAQWGFTPQHQSRACITVYAGRNRFAFSSRRMAKEDVSERARRNGCAPARALDLS